MPFLESLQSDWVFFLINSLVFGVVVLVTWLYAQSRHLATVAQLQVQIQQLQLKQNQYLFDLEDEFNLKKERIRLILKEMELQLKSKDTAMLLARRNELTHVFVIEYRETMHRFARLADQYYELHPQKHQQFVQNFIVPFLETSRSILAAVNAKAVLAQLETQEIYAFSYQDFDFAFDMIRKFPRFSMHRTMHKYLKEIGFNKADLD
jgi:hypothetical protein